MKCTVCTHNQIKDIDRALLTGATLISLSQKYSLSTSAVHRHKTHLLDKMRQAKKRLRASLDQGLFFKLNTYLELSLQAARAASAENNFRALNQSTREGTRVVALMKKMEFELDDELVYCLMYSTQWALQDSLLPDAFQALADTRQTMSVNLFSPCPEPPPPDLDEDDDEDEDDDDDWDDWDEDEDTEETSTSVPEIINPALETPGPGIPPGSTPDPIPAQPQTAQPQTENCLLKMWEKSGKVPGNIPSLKDNSEQYQLDLFEEKNAGKNPKSRRPVASPGPEEISTTPDRDTPDPSPAQNSTLETRNSEPGTLFQRLRRKWAKTGKAPQYSCNYDEIYAEYLRDTEPDKIAGGTASGDPGLSSPIPPPFSQASAPDPALATQNQPPDIPNSAPETPKAREPLDPFTHPKEYYFALEHGYRIEDTPQHKPDRRRQEDFGNPRKIKGCY